MASPAKLVRKLMARFAKLAIGQRWSFTGPLPDESPTLTIRRIDPDARHGRLIFVTVDGTWTPTLTDVQSGPALFPCAEKCVRKTITRLLGSDADVLDIETDYEYFVGEYRADNVGVFELPLSDYLAMYRHLHESRVGA